VALEQDIVGISLAGMGMQIELRGLSDSQRVYYLRSFNERYAAFYTPIENISARIGLSVTSGPPYLEIVPGPLLVESRRIGSRLEYTSYYEKGWYDFDARSGALELRAESIEPVKAQAGDPENFLRVVYAWTCLDEGALLLHAAGLIHSDAGYAFFGPSGSGKTTITSLSDGAQILSDDLVILKLQDTGVRLYGVPFRGEMPEAPRMNLAAPLKGLFALKKAGEHCLEAVPVGVGVGYLSACVPFVMSSPEHAGRVLHLCDEIVRRVPVQILHFKRDTKFWSVINER
jgi:hypothetical protein